MFPGAYSTVYYNDAGEPLGWDAPYEHEVDYDRDPGPDPSDIGAFPGCCKRGDWDGYHCQPDDAFLYVPIVPARLSWNYDDGPRTYFEETTTDAYLWECAYCGRIGTRKELTDT